MIRSDFGQLTWLLARETRLSHHIMNDNSNRKWAPDLWASNDPYTNELIITQLNEIRNEVHEGQQCMDIDWSTWRDKTYKM